MVADAALHSFTSQGKAVKQSQSHGEGAGRVSA